VKCEGGVIGGVLLLIAIGGIVLVLIVLKRRRRRKQTPSNKHNTNTQQQQQNEQTNLPETNVQQHTTTKTSLDSIPMTIIPTRTKFSSNLSSSLSTFILVHI
jgi:uncharacterized protein HemX